jgi:hypothetical protein
MKVATFPTVPNLARTHNILVTHNFNLYLVMNILQLYFPKEIKYYNIYTQINI